MNATGGVADEVRRMVLGARGKFPGIETAARRLNVSERTLRRRLSEEGVSYRGIVDDVRSYLAREYLRETPLCVADVASLLGFDDVANFRRAFRKWNGCAPQDFRSRAADQNGTCVSSVDRVVSGEQTHTQSHMLPHHKTFV